jgi:hypothetical protein
VSITDYKEIILDYINDNKDVPDSEIANDLSNNPVPYSTRHIRRYVAQVRREGDKVTGFESDLKSRKDNARFKDLERKYNGLLNTHTELSDAYDKALLIKEHRDFSALIIDDEEVSMTTGIPIIQLSDWHVEERVERSTTLGLNVCNPDIIKERVNKLFANTVTQIKKERCSHVIDTLIVNLGGDFINNYLHEHDVQMNYMAPIEALMFAESLLLTYLSGLADMEGIKRIKVICNRGNHPRLTRRMQTSNDYKMNLEAILYHSLAGKLNDSIFEWVIPESEFVYIDVFGKKIRTFHGHQVKYGGGVGGLTIPLIKSIMRWDSTIKADFNLMSHFHTYSMPTPNTSLNGSLVGYNSYAMTLGARYEPPVQSLQMLDKKRGFTTRTPIFCD